MYPKLQRMQRDRPSQEEMQLLKQELSDRLCELAGGLEAATVKDVRAVITAREEELTGRAYELDAKEARLESSQADGSVVAAKWAAVAAERQVLAGRWMCLAEDKKALAVLERRLRSSGDDPEPFEPGSLPIQDVSCAIIAHQVDIPLSSCCFQR